MRAARDYDYAFTQKKNKTGPLREPALRHNVYECFYSVVRNKKESKNNKKQAPCGGKSIIAPNSAGCKRKVER